MKRKNICQYLAEGDWAGFLGFIHSARVSDIAEHDAISFFEDAPDRWVLALLEKYTPTPEVEKAIVRYNSKEIVRLLHKMWHLYPSTIDWAFKQDSLSVTESVLEALEEGERPSEEAEVAFVKQGNAELFKIYIEKFGELSEDAERALNEDPNLSPILSIYIEKMAG